MGGTTATSLHSDLWILNVPEPLLISNWNLLKSVKAQPKSIRRIQEKHLTSRRKEKKKNHAS